MTPLSSEQCVLTKILTKILHKISVFAIKITLIPFNPVNAPYHDKVQSISS